MSNTHFCSSLPSGGHVHGFFTRRGSRLVCGATSRCLQARGVHYCTLLVRRPILFPAALVVLVGVRCHLSRGVHEVATL
eukprot:1205438-Prymnesium_polylepis.1